MNPHLNRLHETVQLRCHNICFSEEGLQHKVFREIRKIIIKYSLLSRALFTGLQIRGRFFCMKSEISSLTKALCEEGVLSHVLMIYTEISMQDYTNPSESSPILFMLLTKIHKLHMLMEPR